MLCCLCEELQSYLQSSVLLRNSLTSKHPIPHHFSPLHIISVLFVLCVTRPFNFSIFTQETYMAMVNPEWTLTSSPNVFLQNDTRLFPWATTAPSRQRTTPVTPPSEQLHLETHQFLTLGLPTHCTLPYVFPSALLHRGQGSASAILEPPVILRARKEGTLPALQMKRGSQTFKAYVRDQ